MYVIKIYSLFTSKKQFSNTINHIYSKNLVKTGFGNNDNLLAYCALQVKANVQAHQFQLSAEFIPEIKSVKSNATDTHRIVSRKF